MSGRDRNRETPAGDTLATIRAFIQANLPLRPVPSVPEILTHRAAPRSGLRRLGDMSGEVGTPYWAYDWGGGLALARHVLDHRERVIGRRVLDLGAGSGIVGIAAAKAGAEAVICADTDRQAIAAVVLNAAANGVAVQPLLGDPTEDAPPEVDVVLVGDLFYDAALAARVTAFLDRCVEAGLEVLVGDPGRAFLPHKRLRLLAEYPGLDFGGPTGQAKTTNAVFSFER